MQKKKKKQQQEQNEQKKKKKQQQEKSQYTQRDTARESFLRGKVDVGHR